ncbi:MAG TPA: LppX_LprAFG lipoprotein [Candidatus Dormibacteraeota bacterium]
MLLLALAGACTNSSTPKPETVLQESGQAMAKVKSVSADIAFGPGLSFQGFTLSSATSKIQVPGDSDTVIKVKQQDFLVDVEVITSGGHVWIKVPFGRFTEVTPDEAAQLPSIGGLFDAQHGLPALLPQGQSPAADGSEQMGGVDCDRVKTTYTADQVGQALGGLKPASDIQARLWVGHDDHLLRRVVLTGQLTSAGAASSVDVHLHDFNQPVSIATPGGATGG